MEIDNRTRFKAVNVTTNTAAIIEHSTAVIIGLNRSKSGLNTAAYKAGYS